MFGLMEREEFWEVNGSLVSGWSPKTLDLGERTVYTGGRHRRCEPGVYEEEGPYGKR